ncbi:hypothetical protein SLEP1_g60003 [Rubroshorea leprosula]|uniref:UBN2 domain-containing protein n=2 Tax=Rubroshorea leprosula TaxID=152421 RepID=A0AAV5MU17_9ROSI|nr:hypothetical protein SLEP1_g60003 [Rubroshorea leprosula]
MYARLNDIVTNLKGLGEVYPPQEVVRKVLRSLPNNWEAKKTTIEEFKDLNTFELEDLIGKLMTYEIEVQVDGGVEVVEKKKKDVAFKATTKRKTVMMRLAQWKVKASWRKVLQIFVSWLKRITTMMRRQ